MGSSADEIGVVDFIKLVFWSAPKHLVQTVGQIKHSTTVAVVAPIFGRDDHLGHDVVAQAFETEFGFDLVENTVSVSVLLLVPINVLVNVGYGHQGVHG